MSLSEIDLEALNVNLDKRVESKSISSLTINHKYVIKNISHVSTRYGKTVSLILYEENGADTFLVFLPKRVLDTITEEVIEKVNNSNKKLAFIYLGQKVSLNSSKSQSLFKFALF